MAAPNKQPKMMSSRLNNMKFMQRAGASTHSTPSEPPSKRQRLSSGSAIAWPATASHSNAHTDASPRGAANQAETKWYLSFKTPQPTATESPLRIVSAGYSTLDAAGGGGSSDDNDDVGGDDDPSRSAESTRPVMPGRQSFGKFNRKLEKQQNQDQSPSSSSESESDEEQDADGNDDDDDDDDDDPTGVNALIKQGRKEAAERARAERKAKKAADLAESQRLAEQRRNREINLNEVRSISNSGSSSGNPYANMTCYNCEQKGHRSSECPKKRSGRPSKLLRR